MAADAVIPDTETPEMNGGVLSEIVTVTAVEAAETLPAASRATAPIVCGPVAVVAVSQELTQGAAVSSGPSGAPSSVYCTLVTPTLSATSTESETVPVTTSPSAGATIKTAGLMASGMAPPSTPAVAESRASMSAPRSFPSVPAFLYGLDEPSW